MKHSVAGGAAALLEKSRSRVRGQNFTSEERGTSRNPQKQQPIQKTEEEDDIAAYLSQLSKKTSGKQQNDHKTDDISSGLSDLSLSDEVKQSTTTKFLKKGSTASVSRPGPSQSAHIQQSPSRMSGKTSTSFTSSALERASKLNAKITSRKMKVDRDSSDEDTSIKYQRPNDVSRITSRKLKIDSDSSDLDEDTSTKYQRANDVSSTHKSEVADKFRFMKKSSSKALDPGTSGESKQENLLYSSTQKQESSSHTTLHTKESRTMAGLSSRTGGASDTHLTSTPVRHRKQTSSSINNVYSKIMAELDTDEENMDYLIGDIDDESSSHVQLKEKNQAVIVPEQVSDERVSPQSLSISGPPGMAVGNVKLLSLDESSLQSDSSIAEDVGLTFAGLQTIDDLLPPSNSYPSPKDTPSPDKDVIESVRTMSPPLVEDSVSSISSVHDEHSTRSRTVADSYTSVADSYSSVADSYSSAASYTSKSYLSQSRSDSKSNSSRSRKSSVSRSKTSDTSINTATPAGSDSYSHDFDTLTHSEDASLSDDRTIASDFSTSHGESSSCRTKSSQRSKISKRRGHDVAVQTSASSHSINHHWLNDYQTSPGYLKLLSANVSDAKSHFVDPMVLQTLSSFDPSSLMFHANLSDQVRRTQLAVANTMRQHQAFLESLEEDYRYTTLENTKLFIKRQKKRRKHKDHRETPLEEIDLNVDL